MPARRASIRVTLRSCSTARSGCSGFELQLVGELTPDWNLIAGYAYMDGEILRSNVPGEIGRAARQYCRAIPSTSGRPIRSRRTC